MEYNPTKEVKIDISTGSREDVRIIKLTGPLTIYNFFEFQDISRKDTHGILIVDLTSVPYLDSAALGCLIGIHLSCEKNGRKYALVGVNDRAQSLFAMCGVDRFFVSYPTTSAAESALI